MSSGFRQRQGWRLLLGIFVITYLACNGATEVLFSRGLADSPKQERRPAMPPTPYPKQKPKPKPEPEQELDVNISDEQLAKIAIEDATIVGAKSGREASKTQPITTIPVTKVGGFDNAGYSNASITTFTAAPAAHTNTKKAEDGQSEIKAKLKPDPDAKEGTLKPSESRQRVSDSAETPVKPTPEPRIESFMNLRPILRARTRCRYQYPRRTESGLYRPLVFNVFMSDLGLPEQIWCERVQQAIGATCWRDGGKKKGGLKKVENGVTGGFETMRCNGEGKDKLWGRGNVAVFELPVDPRAHKSYGPGPKSAGKCVAHAMQKAFPEVLLDWQEKGGCYSAPEGVSVPV